jgi:hypothetical protein
MVCPLWRFPFLMRRVGRLRGWTNPFPISIGRTQLRHSASESHIFVCGSTVRADLLCVLFFRAMRGKTVHRKNIAPIGAYTAHMGAIISLLFSPYLENENAHLSLLSVYSDPK